MQLVQEIIVKAIAITLDANDKREVEISFYPASDSLNINVSDGLDGDKNIFKKETYKIYYSVDTNNIKSLELILNKLSDKEETKDDDFLE